MGGRDFIKRLYRAVAGHMGSAVNLKGAAQALTINWSANTAGARTLDEAVALAKAHGVEIPADVAFYLDDSLPLHTFAKYFERASNYGDSVRWSEFYNSFGKIPVKINPTVLESDEAIVAVFMHEFHEVNRLRRIFAGAGGSMRAEVLEDLMGLGRARNLHDQAWDLADQAVLKMRGAKP